jgi:hypothetical protein
LSECPYWWHKETEETTWHPPPNVKPSGYKPNKDLKAINEQKYYE